MRLLIWPGISHQDSLSGMCGKKEIKESSRMKGPTFRSFMI